MKIDKRKWIFIFLMFGVVLCEFLMVRLEIFLVKSLVRGVNF